LREGQNICYQTYFQAAEFEVLAAEVMKAAVSLRVNNAFKDTSTAEGFLY
jgi:hypothetical protein